MKKLLNNVGIKVAFVTVIINFLLFLFKLITGLIGNSNAMVSDAVHSLSDVFTTFIVIFGMIMASKEADYKHPYGHERIESAFAIILSFILLITGLGIGFIGIKAIMNNSTIKIPGIYPLIAAIVSIIVKEGMFHYTMHYAKKINSSSLKADAWHHRSDALSSIGSFIGILGARLGMPILDSLCSILICVLITKSAIEIFMEAIAEMLDTSCNEETTKEIIDTIMSINKTVKINDLKTRMFGSKIYIDAEIAVDGKMSLNNANKIVEQIHDSIEKKYDMVKHCNIHIVPKKKS